MLEKIKLYFKTTDITYLFLCVLISLLSVLTLFSVAEYGNLNLTGKYGDYKPAYTQIFASCLGILCAIAISFVNYKVLINLWPVMSAVCWSLVLLTFIPGIGYAPPGTGSQSWISMPLGMSFQPTEIAKISFYFSFSLHLSKIHNNINKPKYLLPALVHLFLPVIIIHFQGDDGTAMVFLVTGVIMLIMAGLNRWCVAICGGIAVIALPFIWKFVLSTYQKQRVLGLIRPNEFEDGIMYQQLQAKQAISNGGVFGTGLFTNNHHYVPRSENDFIFSYFSESCGFLGSVFLVLAIFLLLFKILYTAAKFEKYWVKNENENGNLYAASYICIGIFATVLFQAVVNISMNIMLLPVMGITLPFFSAGGTSVLMLYICIGIIMSISREHGHI